MSRSEIPIFFPLGAEERPELRPFSPPRGDPFAPQPLEDPFGFRKAVVPVFVEEGDGVLLGMGTAFHVDHWGNLLTADHVIDIVRRDMSPWRQFGPREETVQPGSPVLLVLLGMGLVFGTVGVPPAAMQYVRRVEAQMSPRDDPMAEMRGQVAVQPLADLAHLSIGQPGPGLVATLPIRLAGWRPRVGDWVVALGFPELDASPVDGPELHHLLSEGLHAAYGRVTAGHPRGRGTANPGPVFEVEANWPSGMSGGPVINQAGEVVGVVSRSIEAEGPGPGVGFATAFEFMPWLSAALSTVDPANPRWRLGWALRDQRTCDVLEFFHHERQAREAARTRTGVDVLFGSAALDGTGFISGASRSS